MCAYADTAWVHVRCLDARPSQFVTEMCCFVARGLETHQPRHSGGSTKEGPKSSPVGCPSFHIAQWAIRHRICFFFGIWERLRAEVDVKPWGTQEATNLAHWPLHDLAKWVILSCEEPNFQCGE